MALVSSQLYREVIDTASRGPKPVHFRYEMDLIANGKTFKTMGGVNYSVLRNYLTNYMDDVKVELLLPAGTYNFDILPNRRNLKMRIYAYPLYENGENENRHAAPIIKEWKAVPYDVEDQAVNQNESSAQSKDAANTSTMNRYTFQLMDPVAEQMRLVRVGGIYRNKTPGELLQGLLTQYSLTLDFDLDRKPLGVGMVPPNNTERRQVFVIPHASPLVDQPDGTYGLARYLQFVEGGIYNAGIASYYQGRHWYVFPPFDVSRYEKATKRLTIANIPAKDMRQPERSYRVDGNNVYVLATGNVNYRDQSEHEQLNAGNGVRWASPTKVFDGILKGDGNRAKADRSQTMSEIVGDKNPENLTHAPMSAQPISSNSAAQMTPLAYKRGAVVQLTWENADIDVLFPGMPVRLIYERQKRIEMLDGVLIGAEFSSAPVGNIGAKEAWLTNAALTLFVTRSKVDEVKHEA